mgnify:CR=1 FL=1
MFHSISDLIYIRSAVESSDSKLGFLPGESHEKMAPYLQPLIDKLEEFLNKGDIDFLQKNGHIDSVPVGFLRGLNWNDRYRCAMNITTLDSFHSQ